MSEADKHLSAEELDAIILILEDELAIAEQQPGASWYKATLWHCIRRTRTFATTPHATGTSSDS